MEFRCEDVFGMRHEYTLGDDITEDEADFISKCEHNKLEILMIVPKKNKATMELMVKICSSYLTEHEPNSMSHENDLAVIIYVEKYKMKYSGDRFKAYVEGLAKKNGIG